MKKTVFIPAIIASAILAANAFAGIKENVVELVKPEEESKIFGITHDWPGFKSVAFAVKKDKKMFVQINDRKSPEYDNIGAGTPVVAPETGVMAYIANVEGGVQVFIDEKPVGPKCKAADGLMFSPDGKQYAFRVLVGDKQALVINGQQTQFFEEIRPDFRFSPDSKRFAYIMVKAKDQLVLMADGKESKAYPAIKEPLFSPDSRHLSYSVFTEKGWSLVKDGVEGKPYENIAYATYSPDSSKLVYVAQMKKQLLVVDGVKENPSYRTVSVPAFSPDSKSMMYPAQKGEKWVMVTDGKEGSEFDMMGPYFYSPDSKRRVYVGITKKKPMVVENDNKSEEYDSVGLPVFSPDSKILSYQALDDGKWKMVMNGKSGEEYLEVKQIEFAPSGSRYAYIAIDKDKKYLMVTEKGQGKKYDDLGRPFFSKDGRHLVYSAYKGKDCIITVNGEEGAEKFEGFMKNVPIVFDGPNKFHGLALRMPGPVFYRLECEITE